MSLTTPPSTTADLATDFATDFATDLVIKPIAPGAVITTYPQQIQSTAAAHLQQIAQDYLNAERYTAVVLNPI